MWYHLGYRNVVQMSSFLSHHESFEDAGAHRGPKRVLDPLVLDLGGSHHGCWHLIQVPVLLTAEPPFQPQYSGSLLQH